MPNSSSILNVDHNRLRREAHSKLLSSAGLLVHESTSGRDALQSLKGIDPDVVLLAGKLPDIRGFDMCRELRANPGFSSMILLQDAAKAARARSNGGVALASGGSGGGPDAWLPERCAVQPFLSTVQALLHLRKAQLALSAANQRAQTTLQKLQHCHEEAEGFAFQACHDLEEPVRALSAFTHLMEQAPGRLSPEESMFLGQTAAGIERVRRLFGNLLSYSQIARENKPAPRPVDLNLAARAAIYGLGKEIRESGAEIQVDGHLPLVTGNLARLQQVFQCLLTNAVQYRRPREPLVIRIGALDLTPNETAISVSDNGEGIAKQYHQVIFEAFKRLHGREIPGTGMGLAISKRIVEAHYGRMWVESEPDHGAKFFFSLPKATDK